MEEEKTKLSVKVSIKQKINNMQDEFKKIAEERKAKDKEAEEKIKRDDEKEKARKAQINLNLGKKIAAGILASQSPPKNEDIPDSKVQQ